MLCNMYQSVYWWILTLAKAGPGLVAFVERKYLANAQTRQFFREFDTLIPSHCRRVAAADPRDRAQLVRGPGGQRRVRAGEPPGRRLPGLQGGEDQSGGRIWSRDHSTHL